jgi:CheY-like chemotaxis protein
MNVLIADDEKGLVELMSEALIRRGYAVDTALDGPRALEMLLTGKYDVAFLDLSIPEITGLEIIDEIRKKGIKTKAVMITGYQLMDGEFLKGVGVDEYMAKPLKFEEIQKLLKKYENPS